VTGVIGVLLVFNFTTVFIPKPHLEILTIHAHAGFAGWILLLIIGVSSKVIPMFYKTEKTTKRLITYSHLLINAGLLLLSISIYWQADSLFNIISSLILSTGILFFLYFIIKAFLESKRKFTEVGLDLTSVSFIFLFTMIPLGILLSSGILNPKTTVMISLLYGILFIIGFCGTIILGQALKIIPLMLWKNKYPHPTEKMITSIPEDLISEKVARWMTYLFLTGIILLSASFVFRFSLGINIAAVFLGTSSLLFNYTIYRAILYKPKLIKH
jgi:hypothetical protein